MEEYPHGKAKCLYKCFCWFKLTLIIVQSCKFCVLCFLGWIFLLKIFQTSSDITFYYKGKYMLSDYILHLSLRNIGIREKKQLYNFVASLWKWIFYKTLIPHIALYSMDCWSLWLFKNFSTLELAMFSFSRANIILLFVPRWFGSLFNTPIIFTWQKPKKKKEKKNFGWMKNTHYIYE